MEPIMKRQQRKSYSQLQMLPEDLLADVLSRLSPRSLAVSRCVCKSWHAIIDVHKLLRADLLPLSFGGIVIDFNMPEDRTRFFSYRSCAAAAATTTTTTVVSDGNLLGYLPHLNDIVVVDHCNGLLLLFGEAVANPATQHWSRFPPKPPPRTGNTADEHVTFGSPYLVFDPAISPYYEVFLMPVVPAWAPLGRETAESEWPPLLCHTHVFSSRTGCWEERSFVRKGDPAGTTAEIQRATTNYMERHSAYWREALYIHCPNGFFCKVSVRDNTYQVIKLPVDDRPHQDYYLGKSENGVYCAMIDDRVELIRLRVWIIRESSSDGEMDWVLRHVNNLAQVLASPDLYLKEADGEWIFEDDDSGDAEEEEEEDVDESDDELLTDHWYLTLLGFHPFKETVFLNSSLSRGFAYDLNTSKVQDLGNMCPKYNYPLIATQHADVKASFPYTPCWMDIPKSDS